MLKQSDMFFAPILKEMEKWQIHKTGRGLRLVDARGYTYNKDCHIGNRSYWTCDYGFYNCKARASIIGNINQGDNESKARITFNLMSHGHSPYSRLRVQERENFNEYETLDESFLSPTAILKVNSSERNNKFDMRTKNPILMTKEAAQLEDSEMCLRWNSHHSNMQTVFPLLLQNEKFVDVTLAVEGRLIKCHKLILSSCSDFFDEMFKDVHPIQHPIIYLRGMFYWQVKALIEFMYKGEVNVDQSKLEPLLQAAEELRIKGLAGKGNAFQENFDEPVTSFGETENEEYLDDSFINDDEEYSPPNMPYKKKMQAKKRKRKITNPPDPSSLKQVKINLRGTKSRPNIKQPKFYDPDYPEYDPDRFVSSPKMFIEPNFEFSNIKMETIDVTSSPSSIYDDDIEEEIVEPETKTRKKNNTKQKITTTAINSLLKSDGLKKVKEIKVYGGCSKNINKNEQENITTKEVQIDSNKQIILEPEKKILPPPLIKTSKPREVKELNLNKNAIILKYKNVDGVTTETDFSKYPQIRVRNLPTTDNVLKKFATTPLTSILKKDPIHPIILKKIVTKPTILKHTPKKIASPKAETSDVVEKLTVLSKTKKELLKDDDSGKMNNANIAETSLKEGDKKGDKKEGDKKEGDKKGDKKEEVKKESEKKEVDKKESEKKEVDKKGDQKDGEKNKNNPVSD